MIKTVREDSQNTGKDIKKKTGKGTIAKVIIEGGQILETIDRGNGTGETKDRDLIGSD